MISNFNSEAVLIQEPFLGHIRNGCDFLKIENHTPRWWNISVNRIEIKSGSINDEGFAPKKEISVISGQELVMPIPESGNETYLNLKVKFLVNGQHPYSFWKSFRVNWTNNADLLPTLVFEPKESYSNVKFFSGPIHLLLDYKISFTKLDNLI